MDYIVFKHIKNDKLDKKKVNKYLNKYLLKNRILYIIFKNKNNDLFKEYKIVNELNIEYEIEKSSYKKIENNKVIKKHITKNNINEIKKSLFETDNIAKIIICKDEHGIIEIDFIEGKCIISRELFFKTVEFVVGIIIVVIISILIINSQFTITNKKSVNKAIGIIDGNYTKKYNNVVYNTNPKENLIETHGDNMINFAKELSYDVKIYYYDATNIEGKIDSSNIILGLEYMKDKNVDIINISLSSKKYSSEIENWIKSNPEITVYASYNNLANTFDYPAMYEETIGVGKRNWNISYKEKDKIYFNNKIIILPNLFKIYEGNSYLSLYEILNNI